MEFQLNSRVRLRLFEPVSIPGQPCRRIFDVIGLAYDHENYEYMDAISTGYASRFHHPSMGTAAEIKKASDDAHARATSKDKTSTTPPPVETEVVHEAPTDLKDANSEEDQSTD